MPTRDLHYCELVEIGQRIQKRELSPVEATQAQLDRIARLDGQLKSYAYVMASSALEQAHAAEKEIGSGFMGCRSPSRTCAGPRTHRPRRA
jgi:amidase